MAVGVVLNHLWAHRAPALPGFGSLKAGLWLGLHQDLDYLALVTPPRDAVLWQPRLSSQQRLQSAAALQGPWTAGLLALMAAATGLVTSSHVILWDKDLNRDCQRYSHLRVQQQQ